MKYTEILNRRLKKAGREYRTGNHSDKKERLWNAIQEIMEEAEGTGSFLPWTQAVQKLKLNEQQQMLIAVLWGTETYGDRLSVEEFRRLWIQIYEEEPENMKDLPVWYYFNEEYVELCPVLSGWLEGTMPVLPSGVQLRLTEEKKSYGLEELLAESHRIFSLAEQTGDPMILCLTGAAGSGREYAMEQICAGQDLALLLIDGETFRGTERELNACILSVMLYEAYPCVWLGKTERWELLEKMRESFSFYGVIREEGRALAERPEASVITRKLEQPDRKLKQQMAEEVLGDLADRLPEDISLAHLMLGDEFDFRTDFRAQEHFVAAGGEETGDAAADHADTHPGKHVDRFGNADRLFESGRRLVRTDFRVNVEIRHMHTVHEMRIHVRRTERVVLKTSALRIRFFHGPENDRNFQTLGKHRDDHTERERHEVRHDHVGTLFLEELKFLNRFVLKVDHTVSADDLHSGQTLQILFCVFTGSFKSLIGPVRLG